MFLEARGLRNAPAAACLQELEGVSGRLVLRVCGEGRRRRKEGGVSRAQDGGVVRGFAGSGLFRDVARGD